MGTGAERGGAPAIGWLVAPPVFVRRLRILRSDMLRRCVTGAMRTKVDGSRLTSDFMSANSSSSWFRTNKQTR